MDGERRADDLLRGLAPEVLGAVVRRHGHFDLAEDAVQDALIAAAEQWPTAGRPESPRAWLITVAARRLTDRLRAEQARRHREEAVAEWTAVEPSPGSAGPDAARDFDDSLVLLFLCCHPSLSPASQIALTLRAVGGLTTAEIARALLVPEATMTRRISRAKRTVEASGTPFRLPGGDERAGRLAAVLHVLYLVFTEGYAATSGPRLQRVELADEAIRLTRLAWRLMPDEPEVTGLLALMLLTHARRGARAAPDGTPIPMPEQDRERWDRDEIREGVALVERAIRRRRPGPYQLQAAIAALHDRAPVAGMTDWPQILALYDRLLAFSENPVTRLNRAVAVAMVDGPVAALAIVDALADDGRLSADHRVLAVRAHLLELLGDRAGARAAYAEAAGRATSLPRRRYLNAQVARLSGCSRERPPRGIGSAPPSG